MHTSLAGAAIATSLTACGGGGDDEKRQNFLLVHGSFHNSAHWAALATQLRGAGHRVSTIDLPGFGVNAILPASYAAQDLAALATEVSPVANVTAESMVQAVVDQIQQQFVDGPVTVVGHSFGGAIITKASEQVPAQIRRLVYLSALCPSVLKSVAEMFFAPENSTASGGIFVADLAVVAAARINPKSVDPGYLEKLRDAYYNDMSLDAALPLIRLLTPDTPLGAALADLRGTVDKWGKIPRTYVRTTLDHSVTPTLQDRLIADADSTTPQNKFDVRTLNASHGSFASMPQQLAQILTSV